VEAQQLLTAAQEVEIADRIAGVWEEFVMYLKPEFFHFEFHSKSGQNELVWYGIGYPILQEFLVIHISAVVCCTGLNREPV
jgi:hypothetical protein